MPPFSLSKVDKYNSERSKSIQDIIDLKFPTELKPVELLVFIVDDDPHFLQLLNTHFAKLILEAGETSYKFKVKNFATGNSVLKALDQNPDLIFLNFYINEDMPTALSGHEVLDEIININPNQKVIILNELEEKLRGALVDGLRTSLKDKEGNLEALNAMIRDILNK